MGLGPWAQADLIRDVKRGERGRISRIISREEIKLRDRIRRFGYRGDELEDFFKNVRLQTRPKPRAAT